MNWPSPNTWLNYTDDIKFNGNWLALVNNYNCFVDWNEMDLNRPQNWFRHSPAAVEAAYLMMNVRFLFSVLAPRCWRLPQRLRLDFLVLGAVIVAVVVVRIRLLLEKMHLMNRKNTTYTLTFNSHLISYYLVFFLLNWFNNHFSLRCTHKHLGLETCNDFGETATM